MNKWKSHKPIDLDANAVKEIQRISLEKERKRLEKELEYIKRLQLDLDSADAIDVVTSVLDNGNKKYNRKV